MELLRRKTDSRYTNNSRLKESIRWLDGSSFSYINNGYEYDHEAERAMVCLCKAGGILHIEDVILPNWFVL
jgi:hypothetical protein